MRHAARPGNDQTMRHLRPVPECQARTDLLEGLRIPQKHYWNFYSLSKTTYELLSVKHDVRIAM